MSTKLPLSKLYISRNNQRSWPPLVRCMQWFRRWLIYRTRQPLSKSDLMPQSNIWHANPGTLVRIMSSPEPCMIIVVELSLHIWSYVEDVVFIVWNTVGWLGGCRKAYSFKGLLALFYTYVQDRGNLLWIAMKITKHVVAQFMQPKLNKPRDIRCKSPNLNPEFSW